MSRRVPDPKAPSANTNNKFGAKNNPPPPAKGKTTATVAPTQKGGTGPNKPGQPALQTLAPNGKKANGSAVSPTPSRSTTPRMRDPKAGKVSGRLD